MAGIRWFSSQAFGSVITRLQRSGASQFAGKAIYVKYGKKLKNIHQIEGVSSLLSEMMDEHVFPDTLLINQMIKIVSSKNLQHTLALCRIATERKLADTITYSSTIGAISKSINPDIHLAVQLFEEAKKNKLIDNISYGRILHTISKGVQPDISLAWRFFEEAKSSLRVDSFIYANMLAIISNSPQPDVHLARQLFEEAKTSQLLDEVLYAHLLNIYSRCPDLGDDLGFTLLDEVMRQYKLPDMEHGTVIDLHGLSYGMVYFGLKKRIQKEINASDLGLIKLTLIYGQGLHSRSSCVEKTHALKQAVNRLVQDMLTAGVSGQEDQQNRGRFELTIRPKSPQNNLNQHALFNRVLSTKPRHHSVSHQENACNKRPTDFVA